MIIFSYYIIKFIIKIKKTYINVTTIKKLKIFYFYVFNFSIFKLLNLSKIYRHSLLISLKNIHTVIQLL